MKSKNLILFIAMFQIFLLINLATSHSYFISQTNSLDTSSKIEEKSMVEKLMNSGINLLVGFLSIKQIGIVSAEEFWCCEETTEGEICRDIPVGDDSFCKGQVWPTDCKSTEFCKIGTCIDKKEGVCSVGTLQGCINDWDSRSIGEVDECKLGCCTLREGTNKQFIEKIKCDNKEGSFDSGISQRDCVVYTEEMGACVLENGDCKFTTEQDCEINLNGDSYPRFLCSNPVLETNCEASKETTCYNNKVYFLDTCGNLANVYDSEKVYSDSANEDIKNYWDIVQEPGCSSVVSSETCGNCKDMESICSEGNAEEGSYICKNLNCIDKHDDNKERKNTEAWCVYESYVGDSRDVVGSEYRVRYCDKGEIKTELCENYRGQICGGKINGKGEDSFSVARCMFNEGWKCYQAEMESYEYYEDGKIINEDKTEEKNNETCESISSCRLEQVDLYNYYDFYDLQWDGDNKPIDLFKFDMCVPKYPPGLEFWDSSSNAKDMCGIMNSVTCTTQWVYWGAWYCKSNCECLTQEFADEMNDVCISLGDCGGYVNVEGEYTKNFKTFDINSLEKYVKTGGKDKYVMNIEAGGAGGATLTFDADGDIKDEDKYKKYSEQIGQGYPPKFLSSTEQGYWGGDPLENLEWTEEDFPNIASTVLTITSAVIGAVGGLLISLGGIASVASAVPIVGWIVAAIAATITVILAIFSACGFGETKEIVVEFKCQPWQPPVGGKDCEKCNENPLRPCTEYKCRSLGSTCRILEEVYESENPVCINAHPYESVPPEIIFGEINKSFYSANEKSKGNGVDIRTSKGGCIQEFTPIQFTLETKDGDEEDYARCVYNWESGFEPPTIKNDYALIGEEFNEGNFYSTTHTFETRLPFVSSLNEISGNLGERQGEANIYVRCMDYAGNFNPKEYVVNFCIREGPDNTAARILGAFPMDRSFLKYGVNETSLIIYLDEPAECSWTTGSYDEMTNFTDCEDYVEGQIKPKWRCSTTLTDLTKLTNNIYIKCKDQPWISEGDYKGPWDETDRNENAQGFLYTLYATENPLEIVSISPQGEIIRGGETSEGLDLEVKTSGGMKNGVSICEYEFIEPKLGWDFFLETGSKNHKQLFNPPTGNYNISVICKDEVGNKATANSVFSLIVDDSAPIIVRAYKDERNLKLITDEDATCYYGLEECNFNLEDGVLMTLNKFSTTHIANWNPGVIYYIRCADIFGNVNSGCTKKIITSS
ncbi:hypothetical protein KAJ87_02750 [Candidatus Pacearchaeota archaeon]|nr:hypothetical protein [Candidatus Pacearchaeota archaeon]